MVGYCGEVWRFRYFWLSLVRMDLRTRYRGSVLGMGWSLLQPLALTGIFCIVFGKLFDQDVGEFAPKVMAGLAYWTYLTQSILSGCQCFFSGESYIRQYPAPMAIYPLRTMLGAAFHFSLALLMATALAGVCLHRLTVAGVLSLLPTMVLLMLFGWALALLAGLATVLFRDTRHLLEILLQLLFYLTPIMYPPEVLQDRGMGWLMDWNPLMPFLRLLRDPLIDGRVAPLEAYASAALVLLLAVGAAALAMSRLEKRLIFEL